MPFTSTTVTAPSKKFTRTPWPTGWRSRKVQQQCPLKVYDEDGTILGEYFADLIVEEKLIVELKAQRSIADENIAQILGYLRSARVETGLLINFGAPKLHVKKYLMTDNPPSRNLFRSVSTFLWAMIT